MNKILLIVSLALCACGAGTGLGGHGGAAPCSEGGGGADAGADTGEGGASSPTECIAAPEHVATIPDRPCWWDGDCSTWFGCFRGICQAYYGDPAEPGYCSLDLADNGTICGADPVTGAEWLCNTEQRCCSQDQ